MQCERKMALVRYLVQELIEEFDLHGVEIPPSIYMLEDADASFQDMWLAFRSLVNVRPPWSASREFLVAQDELLQTMIEEAGLHTIADAVPSALNPQLRLWRGDITTIAADAIVNAANSSMTGCWQPLHYCIDNAIHTFAGVQLRIRMASIMEAQGHAEPTGQAKITSGYNLPARHILHTVGPIANGLPTDQHRKELSSSYLSCLDLAAQNDCLSIVFCCISTGVFGFPQEEAADIAIRTCLDRLSSHPDSPMTIVFNVYGEDDEVIYAERLGC